MEVDEDADEWEEEEKLPIRWLTKRLALKLLRNRCIAHATSESAVDMLKPVMKMLVTLLESGGILSPESADVLVHRLLRFRADSGSLMSLLFYISLFRPTVKSRLRYQAAVSLLHLAKIEKFAEKMTPHFNQKIC